MKWSFYIAGVQFHEAKTVLKKLIAGESLDLVLEPTNKYDPNAVAIHYNHPDVDGVVTMLGYVPGKLSAQVAASIEMGREVTCVLDAVQKDEKPWKQLYVILEEKEEEPADAT